MFGKGERAATGREMAIFRLEAKVFSREKRAIQPFFAPAFLKAVAASCRSLFRSRTVTDEPSQTGSQSQSPGDGAFDF